MSDYIEGGNRYPGKCRACGEPVAAGDGVLEYIYTYRQRIPEVWCRQCFDESDDSGPEDRCCGRRAQERDI